MIAQIYIRYDTNNGKGLIAKDLHFNLFAPQRMISFSKWVVTWAHNRIGASSENNVKDFDMILDGIASVLEGDAALHKDLIEEYRTFCLHGANNQNFDTFVFYERENQSCKLVVDVTADGVKYAFGNRYLHWHGENDVMDCRQFLNYKSGNQNWERWIEAENAEERGEVIERCNRDIRDIENLATLMTAKDIEEFCCHDYYSLV